ncbi:Type IV pilin N-term methylation site GFxxxE [Malonomonas rubra DSM 5091]|uniref:Type IV pilin N-term methylation site GFxxxE n=1 Tax=Malonomonas rubra DSM 5091 TaxID=1122189 RepID=A0A1M6M622_MALRU|nr:prepilin-type N-terminal cleavage/methylation domain-containing protein [Malonomonas rubra]SHJ78915.1 Type IV pilin N-term methylation site GFxxxE [Malonomonas rubra DSM 5091]
MNVYFSNLTQIRGQRGYTLLEIVVVIAIISILAAFALDKYARLLVDVERTSMQHDLGVMRSAVSMQFASHFVAGDVQGLNALIDTNPMDLLSEKPSNYLGVFKASEAGKLEAGHWYFDNDNRALVYLVRHVEYFETKLRPKQARFKIFPVYSEKQKENKKKLFLAGLRLKAIDPYRWIRE